jgi:hypothetical protein
MKKIRSRPRSMVEQGRSSAVEAVTTVEKAMEAKVDIRKLQLLNDRINQTIDALNQVRLSVHGLSHSMGVPGVGYSPYGQQFGQGFAQQGFGQGVGQGVGPQMFGQGIGQGIGPQAFGPYQQGTGWGGMSHTTGVPGWGLQALGMNPYFQAGLSHTGSDVWGQQGFGTQQGWGQQQLGIDPYYGMRLAQTFPFAQMPLSPIG